MNKNEEGLSSCDFVGIATVHENFDGRAGVLYHDPECGNFHDHGLSFERLKVPMKLLGFGCPASLHPWVGGQLMSKLLGGFEWKFLLASGTG